MSLDFLSPEAEVGSDAGPIARSPMESMTRAAGARFELRDGWSVAIGYGRSSSEEEAQAAARSVGWADVSHLGKLELQAAADQLDSIASGCDATLELGEAVRAGDTWWCRLTPTRARVIGETAPVRELRRQLTEAVAGAEHAGLVDVSCNLAAITLAGPAAREVLARFCALDLRPARAPVGALRPGSIARQPGTLICEAPDRYLFTFGWATGEYVWSVVADAGAHLGGRPIGLDALGQLAGDGAGDGDGDGDDA